MAEQPDKNGASVTGRAYPPLSSQECRARLSQAGDVIWLISADDTVLTKADLAALDIEPRVGRTERRVRFPDGSLFLTDDHNALERLTGAAKGGLLHAFEQFHPRLIAVVLACFAGGWVVWKYGLTMLVAIAVWLTPDALRQAIDSGTMQTFDKFVANPSKLDAEKQAEARAAFATLLTEMGPAAKDFDYRIEFRSAPRIGPNAFALPNGTIVVTDALVSMSSPGMLAGVMGHEIGHVAEQHGLRQMYRATGAFVLISMLAGDTGPVLEELLLEGNLLLSLSYSREHELAADRFGYKLVEQAGLGTDGLSEFFDRLQKSFGNQDAGWFGTHPGFEERKQQLRDLRNNR